MSEVYLSTLPLLPPYFTISLLHVLPADPNFSLSLSTIMLSAGSVCCALRNRLLGPQLDGHSHIRASSTAESRPLGATASKRLMGSDPAPCTFSRHLSFRSKSSR